MIPTNYLSKSRAIDCCSEEGKVSFDNRYPALMDKDSTIWGVIATSGATICGRNTHKCHQTAETNSPLCYSLFLHVHDAGNSVSGICAGISVRG